MVEVKVEMKTEWWQQQSNDCNNNSPNENSMTKEKPVEMAIQLILFLKRKQPNIIKDTGD